MYVCTYIVHKLHLQYECSRSINHNIRNSFFKIVTTLWSLSVIGNFTFMLNTIIIIIINYNRVIYTIHNYTSVMCMHSKNNRYQNCTYVLRCNSACTDAMTSQKTNSIDC